MVRSGLPKKYARMGFKKGWKAYKATKSRSRSSPVKKRRVTMARRKTRRRRATRTIRRYRKSGGSAFNLKKMIIPIAAATFIEPTVDQLVNQFAGSLNINFAGIQIDDIAKVGIGLYFGKKGGIMGNTAKMIGIFAMRNIVSGFVGGGLGNIFGGAGATSTSSAPNF